MNMENTSCAITIADNKIYNPSLRLVDATDEPRALPVDTQL